MSLYLVTGATGFIGRQLCTHIRQRGHQVRALLRREQSGPWDETVICDLASQALPGALLTDIDGIFHCAGAAHFRGLSRDAEKALWHLNVDATTALFELARRAGTPRLVYFSSVQAAGKPGTTVADETWHAPPDNIYGKSKLTAERALFEIAGQAMHASVVRPTLVYGPGVKGNLERMLGAVVRGRMPPLPDSGKQRSMAALENVVTAAWLAMENPAAAGRSYIVCDDAPYSTRQLYCAMMAAAGRDVPGYHLPLPLFKLAALAGDLGNRLTDNAMPWDSGAYERLFGEAVYSASRIKGDLGWQPQANFETQLPAMIAAVAGAPR